MSLNIAMGNTLEISCVTYPNLDLYCMTYLDLDIFV